MLERYLSPHTDRADDVGRITLGVVILLAGLHKLVAPGAWSVYAAPWFEAVWPLAMDSTMVLFGVTEIPVGLALLADWYTTLAAVVVAVSMVGTVFDLATIALATGRFVDVLIRDLGLFGLAVVVALRSADEG